MAHSLHPQPRNAGSLESDVLVDVPSFGVCRRVDIFDAWLFAQAEVEVTFRTWAKASTAGRGEAHAVYRAALDREERAAIVLEAVMR